MWLLRRLFLGASKLLSRTVVDTLDLLDWLLCRPLADAADLLRWLQGAPCRLLGSARSCSAAVGCSWLKGECTETRGYEYCNQGRNLCAGYVFAFGIDRLGPFPGDPCDLGGDRCDFSTIQLVTYRERPGYVWPPWGRDDWDDRRAVDPRSGLAEGEQPLVLNITLTTQIGSRREDQPVEQQHRAPWHWNMAQRPRPPTPRQWRDHARRIQQPCAWAAQEDEIITLWRHSSTHQLLKVGQGNRTCRRILQDESRRGVGNLVLNWAQPRPTHIDVMCIPFTSERVRTTLEVRASGGTQDIQAIEWAIRSVFLPANELIESDFRYRFIYEVNARCHSTSGGDDEVLASALGPKGHWCHVAGGFVIRCRSSDYARCRAVHEQRRQIYFDTVYPAPHNTEANRSAFFALLKTSVQLE